MEESPLPPVPRDLNRWDDEGEPWDSSHPPDPPPFGTVLPAPPSAGSALSDPLMPDKRNGPLSPLTLAVGLGVAGLVGLGLGVWLASGEPAPPSVVEIGAPGPSLPEAPETPERPAVSPPPQRCPDGMEFIHGGKFFMGSDAKHPILRSASPAHQVDVDDFCLDQTEVTLGAYRQCSTRGECKRAFRDSAWPQGGLDEPEWQRQLVAFSALCNENYDDRDEHPVNCVTWYQAEAYCAWRGAKLPSEAEWEYAARGSDGRVYSWGDQTPDSERMNGCGQECLAWRADAGLSLHANLYDQDDGFPGTAPVRSFPAGRSQHGLYDMAGNVFEWTADQHRPYSEAGKSHPSDDETNDRVIRGGAFNSFMPEFADPALRFPQAQDAHTHGIGFRCASKPLL